MFEVSKPSNRARRVSLLASFLVHCFVIILWLERPPMFVQPSSVAWGLHGNSENLVYFPTATKPSKVSKKLQFARKRKQQLEEPPVKSNESARAGSENGSFFHGVTSGEQAMPALPTIFPDPEIYPWQLKGLQGDVVVEVTIDEKGNVTNTRVLQSLQQEIDDKVIATLRSWRFKPASVDGVAISSRQDVHFHFPS
jgi:TonB family protein